MTNLYLKGTENPLTSKGKRVGHPFARLLKVPNIHEIILMDDGNECEVTKVGSYNGCNVAIIRVINRQVHCQIRQEFQYNCELQERR